MSFTPEFTVPDFLADPAIRKDITKKYLIKYYGYKDDDGVNRVFDADGDYYDGAGESIDEVLENGQYQGTGIELMDYMIKEKYWDLTQEDIDRLDSLDYFVSKELKELRKQFVLEKGIKPKYYVGQRVKFKFFSGLEETGEITRVDADYGEYLILTKEQEEFNKLGKGTNLGWSIGFEDVIGLTND